MTQPVAGDDYRDAGLAGRLAPGRSPALIVIDPVRAYTDPDCPLYAGVESACTAMQALLTTARRAGVPTIITRVEHDTSGRTGGLFAEKVPATRWFTQDSPFAGYIEGLEPQAGDLEIVKEYPSAFAGTTLIATLNALRVDTLVITGLTTSGCVRATALDALQSGFRPFVVREAVGDRLEGPHEANLFDIQAKIGEVVSALEAERILRSVG